MITFLDSFPGAREAAQAFGTTGEKGEATVINPGPGRKKSRKDKEWATVACFKVVRKACMMAAKGRAANEQLRTNTAEALYSRRPFGD